MSKCQLIADLPHRNIITLIIFLFFFPLQSVVPDVEQTALRYIATQLLPNECQSIINHKVERSPNRSPSNGIDCFRKLVGWTSNLRINRRDAHLVLGNRLRQIGRDDLATWLVGPASQLKPVGNEQTVEYKSWKSGKIKNVKMNRFPQSGPTISEMDKLIFGSAPQIRPSVGLLPNFGQRSVASVPEIRKLNGIHAADSLRDHPLVMVDQDSNRLASPAADGVTVVTTAQNQHSEEHGGGISTVKGTGEKEKEDMKNTEGKSNQTNNGKPPDEDKKHNKSSSSKFSHLLPHFTDDKNAPCLRVPLSTALVVLGTIMTLTCCCALLLRNRIAACFDRLRGKKNKGKPSKRVSVDEEQGFMGPRTFGKPPVRSGRKGGGGGGGSIDVTNVGIQNSNPTTATNGSREFDERSTGCCNCCARKKRKNKRKRKK